MVPLHVSFRGVNSYHKISVVWDHPYGCPIIDSSIEGQGTHEESRGPSIVPLHGSIRGTDYYDTVGVVWDLPYGCTIVESSHEGGAFVNPVSQASYPCMVPSEVRT